MKIASYDRTITVELDPGDSADLVEGIVRGAVRMIRPSVVEIIHSSQYGRSIYVVGPYVRKNGEPYRSYRGRIRLVGEPNELWPGVAIDALALTESTPDGAS